jgi:hypothetical protein
LSTFEKKEYGEKREAEKILRDRQYKILPS